MLPLDFYLQEDVLSIAKELLGKILIVKSNNKICSGIISETEAYKGITDKASHAYGGRRTNRTETMFASGGIAYVYLCYGIHHLFNVVTNVENIPHAVLIRAIKPLENIELMTKRANDKKMNNNGIGPGKLSAMLGINKNHNGVSLLSEHLHICDLGLKINKEQIKTTTRIGIDYAEEDAKLPYRFLIDHKHINSF